MLDSSLARASLCPLSTRTRASLAIFATVSLSTDIGPNLVSGKAPPGTGVGAVKFRGNLAPTLASRKFGPDWDLVDSRIPRKCLATLPHTAVVDRKSTRLNSSH